MTRIPPRGLPRQMCIRTVTGRFPSQPEFQSLPPKTTIEGDSRRVAAAFSDVRQPGKSWARWALQLEQYICEPKRPPTLAPFPPSPVNAGCMELVCCLHIMQAESPIKVWYDEADAFDIAAWERLGVHTVRRPGTFTVADGSSLTVESFEAMLEKIWKDSAYKDLGPADPRLWGPL